MQFYELCEGILAYLLCSQDTLLHLVGNEFLRHEFEHAIMRCLVSIIPGIKEMALC